jgi:hypothetical protein
MAKTKQKTVTISGKKVLEVLERYYKEESDKSMHRISFAEFLTRHAIRDIEREKGEREVGGGEDAGE